MHSCPLFCSSLIIPLLCTLSHQSLTLVYDDIHLGILQIVYPIPWKVKLIISLLVFMTK